MIPIKYFCGYCCRRIQCRFSRCKSNWYTNFFPLSSYHPSNQTTCKTVTSSTYVNEIFNLHCRIMSYRDLSIFVIYFIEIVACQTFSYNKYSIRTKCDNDVINRFTKLFANFSSFCNWICLISVRNNFQRFGNFFKFIKIWCDELDGRPVWCLERLRADCDVSWFEENCKK